MMPRYLLSAAAAAVLLVPAPALAQHRQQQSEQSFEWTGTLSAGNWIRVRNMNGQITVLPSEGSTVRVTAEKRWRRGDPELVRAEVRREGNDIIVCGMWEHTTRCDAEGYSTRRQERGSNRNDVSLHFTIHVPNGVHVMSASTNGGVSITGTRGEVQARSTNGNVEVAETRGPVVASTTNGNVRVSTASGPVRASTTNGGIDVRMDAPPSEGDMSFRTTNGSITLTVPANFNAEIAMSTTNGSLNTDFPLTVQGQINRRNLQATLGSGGRRVELRTTNGNVSLRRSN